MSYDLELFFEPAIGLSDYLQHFSTRKHYTPQASGLLVYENPDTGVTFELTGRSGSSGEPIASALFNLNYFRPSFFGLEAEIEITALVNRFQPRIYDPQTQGMGDGPYSGEGLLRAWSHGNDFAARATLALQVQARTLPSDTLRRAWRWNYQRLERVQELEYIQYVPLIRPIEIGGQTALSVVWADSMPILLPRVDFVFIGREENGTQSLALAPFAAVVEVLRSAAQSHPDWRGIRTDDDPISVEYPEVEPLPALLDWAAGLPVLDLSTVSALGFDQIVDSEIMASAAEGKPPSPRSRP